VHAAKYRVAPRVTNLRDAVGRFARDYGMALLAVSASGVLLALVAMTMWSRLAEESDPAESAAVILEVGEVESVEREAVVPDDNSTELEELEPGEAGRRATRGKRVRRRFEPRSRSAATRASALKGGKLDVKIQPVDAGLAEAAGIMVVTGAYVTSVVAGGAADRSGVRPGDIILSIGGRTVKNARALAPVVSRIESGRTTKLVLWRERRAVIVDVTL
jgi:C-terminal processing protease CtpA/Prc